MTRVGSLGRGLALAALLALAGPFGCASTEPTSEAAAEAAPSSPALAMTAPSGVHVAEVRGAPADGGALLSRSLGGALRNAGRPSSEDPKTAAYTVRGEVMLGPVIDERRNIRILWRVFGVGGEEMGSAGQENTVPRAVIDGAWDRLAPVIAEAAVPGIEKVIAMAEHERKSAPAVSGEPLTPPAAPEAKTAVAGRPMIQLGSWRAREGAEKNWTELQSRHGDLLGGLDHRVVAADLGGRGTFHRLQVGPLKDVASAKDLCAALAGRKVACLVVTRGG